MLQRERERDIKKKRDRERERDRGKNTSKLPNWWIVQSNPRVTERYMPCPLSGSLNMSARHQQVRLPQKGSHRRALRITVGSS